jgi:hypothetical protein
MADPMQSATQSATQGHRSRSHKAVIRVYDEAGKVIETHEQAGEFKEWSADLLFAFAGAVVELVSR